MSKLIISSLICAICLPLAGLSNLPDSLKLAESMMQQKKYPEVIKALKTNVPAAYADYSAWLKALAYYKNNEQDNALTICKEVIKKAGDNEWLFKTRFLAAEIYLNKKQYKEAESIYQAEAERLLSVQRKAEIAGIYITLAEKLSYVPKPEELDKPQPDYNRAFNFYNEALKLGISDNLRENVYFQMARLKELARNNYEAIQNYVKYLEEFDPDWQRQVGPVKISGSVLVKGSKEHIYSARLNLGEMYLKQGYLVQARVVLNNLIEICKDNVKYHRLALRRIPVTYKLPYPGNDFDLENGIQAVKAFLSAYPDDAIAPTLAWYITLSYLYRNQTDKAFSALQDYIKQGNFKIAGDESTEEKGLRESLGILNPPAVQFEAGQMEAYYKLGELSLGRKDYAAAVAYFSQYIARFPNGAQWTNAQQGIINAEYQEGLDLIAAKKYREGEQKWESFLVKHPLDMRSRQIMFTLAQIQYQEAKEIKTKDNPGALALFQKAVAGFKKLVSKYPNTEESSLAQFRVGEIQESELEDLEAALQSYRALTWGSYYTQAAGRVAQMVNKELVVRTERIYRTTEKAVVKIKVRNIDKVKLNAYELNLEAYFRKAHSIMGIESLDLALIQPDKSWEVKIAKYKAYLPLEQELEIPMNGAGVFAVNIASDDLEATTLVIRSDIDLVVKTSKKECLVFVEDMTGTKAAAGVKLILTDGNKVLAEGVTGKDGVLVKKLTELTSAANLNVFAVTGKSVAATGLDIYSLGFSKGLSARGYIYTDKPAYRPGETVNIRGILRDVKEGSYAVPQGAFQVRVLDAVGKVILQDKVKMSAYGSFGAAVTLASQVAYGKYSVLAENAEQKLTFSGSFTVADYKLEKIRLSLNFNRDLYFRSETIKAVFTAEYYFGQPVAEHELSYRTPDGLTGKGKTDKNGILEIAFDTTPFNAGSALLFYGSLPGENVEVSQTALLAAQGFYIVLAPNRDVALQGEAVEVLVRTTDAAGKPTSQVLDLSLVQKLAEPVDTLFGNIPWIQNSSTGLAGYTEKEVAVKQLTTDAAGIARISFTMTEGGDYILRARSLDRFNTVITADTGFFVSDKEDAVKLRFFADRQHFKVGESGTLVLHSRIESKALVLITFEGENIISYQVKEIKPDKNSINLKIEHSYFPNFAVSAAVMDKNTFYTASLPCTVERELKVNITSEKRSFEPGEKTDIELSVLDHAGKPVVAELSLSLVNEALLALYRDPVADIVGFFQEGAYREAAMLTQTSCIFAYYPDTVAVIKEIQEEALRMEEEKVLYAKEEMREKQDYFDELDMEDKPSESKKGEKAYSADTGGDFAESTIAEGGKLRKSSTEPKKPEPAEERKELPGAGYWVGSVVTDNKGKAKVTLPVPEDTGAFRLQFKGCTVDTLVGETAVSLTVRKDFFASLKVPAILQEGDTVAFMGRVHNLTDYQGPVSATLTLTVAGNKIKLPVKNLSIGSNETKELLFDSYPVPLADKIDVALEITAGGKYSDKVAQTVLIRAWGLPYSASSSGVTENSTTVLLKLPQGLKYLSRELSIMIQPDVNDSIIGLLLENNAWKGSCFPEPPATRLLAALYTQKYLVAGKYKEAWYTRLYSEIQGLISELVSTQNSEGYWNWGLTTTEYALTASAYWALVLAGKEGYEVDKNVVIKTRDFLKDKYSAVSQDDNETKAIILHALSLSGDADFSFVNRLHRNRNQMNASGLAYTALCLAAMDKKDLGREILEAAATRMVVKQLDTGDGNFWNGNDNNAWYRNNVETTALMLLAYQEILPGAKEIPNGVAYLLSEKREYGFYPEKVTGLAVAALARYYGQTQVQNYSYAVDVFCNDKKLGSLSSKNNLVPQALVIRVPADGIKDGDNRIEFKHSGSGKFAYTASLTGFSSELVDPKAWTYPAFNFKKYIHQPLVYNGKVVAESTMEIGQLEYNQVTNVKLDFYSGSRDSFLVLEEYIPAGAIVLMETITGTHNKVTLEGGKLSFFFEPKKYISTVSYTLATYLPGEYRILPPVLRDPMKPEDMRIGKEGKLKILASGISSTEEYVMNEGELFGFGKATFDDGNYNEALKYLEALYKKNPELQQPDTARMLLWIRTEKAYFDANRVVEYFEILKEKYPDLSIPFDKILTVGSAYQAIGEYERAYLVYKATIEASFYKDSAVAGFLEKNEEFINSIEYITKLLNEYPDLNAVITTWFSIAQEIYNKYSEKQTYNSITLFGTKKEPVKYTPESLLTLSEEMLNSFITLYPDHMLVDDAAFSMLNINLDKREYTKTVSLSKTYQNAYKESDFYTKFQYMEALGWFSLRKFDEAIKIAKTVADGESDNSSLATYILGQIYHARREPGNAIEYYNRISDEFTDAGEAVAYFEKKSILIPEVNIFTPKEAVSLKLEYRNIKEAFFQVYKVDLMKLYLREKNLSKITKINLAGISPFLETSLKLGDGKDYADKDKQVSFKLTGEGAYLVVCRGDDLFTSGLILITPLTVEVQEDIESGRIRVNIFDKTRGIYPDNVHIKVIGSDNTQFVSGNTDLRGIFVADGIVGFPTVIARYNENQYAFYRGKSAVGSYESNQMMTETPMESDFDTKYRGNLFEEQKQMQQLNRANLDFLYEQDISGVEVQMAK